MGGGSFSHDTYQRVASFRATKSADQVFTQSQVQEVHPDLDPKGVKVRESCDSPEHPESNAVGIWFDQTGSMGLAPELFAKGKLGPLMRILISKGYLDHPQILHGAFGDFSDRQGIVQVGQFESDNRMDDCLTKLWLVGNGGGQACESSELAFYFMARHTKIDCFDKRGKKGYMFLITDEKGYPVVSAAQAEEIFGDRPEADIPIEAIIEEVRDRYETFLIYLSTHSYSPGIVQGIEGFWKKIFGERMLTLHDPADVSELISSTIGLCEGREVSSIQSDLGFRRGFQGHHPRRVHLLGPVRQLGPRHIPGQSQGIRRQPAGGGGIEGAGQAHLRSGLGSGSATGLVRSRTSDLKMILDISFGDLYFLTPNYKREITSCHIWRASE